MALAQRRRPTSCARFAAVALVAATLFQLPGAAHAETLVDEPTIRLAIESTLELDTGRQAPRLPRVSLDADRGDVTVVFAMRRPGVDDPVQIVNSATDDVFTILWAAYTSGAAPRIQKVTVLGTYAVVGRYARPREIPLMRAVLSVERAAHFDWSQVAVANPGEVLDDWWVESELH
jgi:hypothetical protein